MKRTTHMVVRLTETELDAAHALAADRGEPLTVVVRDLLRRAYRLRWGDCPPPPRRDRMTTDSED